MKDLIKSKAFNISALVVGIILFGLVCFSGGVAVGIFKARFSYNFGNNYERNFLGSRQGMMGGNRGGGMMGFFRNAEGKDYRNAHGISGTIISITDNNLAIKDKDGKENTIAVSDKTVIKNGRESIKITDLKANDQIVVLGNPGDNGVINASLIRVYNNNSNNDND
jgi:hypothetical protein